MKRLMLLCLLAGTVLSMSAQSNNWIYNQSSGWTYLEGMSRSDQYFNPVNRNWLRHQFIIDLSGGNRMIVQMASKSQLPQLLNMDSILLQVQSVINELKDSLKTTTNNLKLDYSTDFAGITRIRTQVFPSTRQHYVLQQKELASLKIEQDTIVISGMIKKSTAERIDYRGIYYSLPYKITLLMNNYAQLATLINGNLGPVMEQIRSEWNSNEKWSSENNWRYNLAGYYNLADPSKNSRIRNTWNRNRFNSTFAPYVHLGVQAINGRFSPSAGAGIEMINSYRNSNNHFQLFWEPYFYFDQTSTGKNKMYRNDFVSFQYVTVTYDNTERNKVLFNQLFSIGYLVSRRGDFLEPNTVKMGLPGARYRDVFLHPEFVFNKFFKDFQPSLKLMLYLD